MNKTHLILAGDLRKLIKKLKNSIFVSKWISQGRDFILINHWYIRGTLTLKRMIFPKMHHLKRGETLAFCDFQYFPKSHFSWKLRWLSSEYMKTFSVNISYFHRFSSFFSTFWHFLVTKKLMTSANAARF